MAGPIGGAPEPRKGIFGAFNYCVRLAKTLAQGVSSVAHKVFGAGEPPSGPANGGQLPQNVQHVEPGKTAKVGRTIVGPTLAQQDVIRGLWNSCQSDVVRCEQLMRPSLEGFNSLLKAIGDVEGRIEELDGRIEAARHNPEDQAELVKIRSYLRGFVASTYEHISEEFRRLMASSPEDPRVPISMSQDCVASLENLISKWQKAPAPNDLEIQRLGKIEIVRSALLRTLHDFHDRQIKLDVDHCEQLIRPSLEGFGQLLRAIGEVERRIEELDQRIEAARHNPEVQEELVETRSYLKGFLASAYMSISEEFERLLALSPEDPRATVGMTRDCIASLDALIDHWKNAPASNDQEAKSQSGIESIRSKIISALHVFSDRQIKIKALQEQLHMEMHPSYGFLIGYGPQVEPGRVTTIKAASCGGSLDIVRVRWPQETSDRSLVVKRVHELYYDQNFHSMTPSVMAALATEGEIQQACQDHPFICQCVLAPISLMGKDRIAKFIVMEHLRGGNLGDRNFQAVPVEIRLKWAMQMLSGIAHMHRKGFVHRDLKHNNVLLTEAASEGNEGAGDLKIIDFGSVQRIGEISGILSTPGNSLANPPEYHHEGTVFDPKYDSWGLGILLFQMFTSLQKEELKNFEDDIDQRKTGAFRAGPSSDQYTALQHDLSPEALRALLPQGKIYDGIAQVISKLFCIDPKNRLTAEQALVEFSRIAPGLL